MRGADVTPGTRAAGRGRRVFAGPILHPRDPVLRDVRVPLAYWKLVAWRASGRGGGTGGAGCEARGRCGHRGRRCRAAHHHRAQLGGHRGGEDRQPVARVPGLRAGPLSDHAAAATARRAARRGGRQRGARDQPLAGQLRPGAVGRGERRAQAGCGVFLEPAVQPSRGSYRARCRGTRGGGDLGGRRRRSSPAPPAAGR